MRVKDPDLIKNEISFPDAIFLGLLFLFSLLTALDGLGEHVGFVLLVVQSVLEELYRLSGHERLKRLEELGLHAPHMGC